MPAYNIGYSIGRWVESAEIGEPEQGQDPNEWTDEAGAAIVDESNIPIIFTP